MLVLQPRPGGMREAGESGGGPCGLASRVRPRPKGTLVPEVRLPTPAYNRVTGLRAFRQVNSARASFRLFLGLKIAILIGRSCICLSWLHAYFKTLEEDNLSFSVVKRTFCYPDTFGYRRLPKAKYRFGVGRPAKNWLRNDLIKTYLEEVVFEKMLKANAFLMCLTTGF